MTTYVIGDLQGCYDELQNLLSHINYNPDCDHLWFVGDIVNRGPKSLECLRFVKELHQQGKADMVLGNHDFHLLAAYSGLEKFVSKSDTLNPILTAHDVDELMDWLRNQPLMVKHPVFHAAMVHAGIPPQWSINEALSYAQEVHQQLKQTNWQEYIVKHLFGSEPNRWHDNLAGYERLRYIVNAFARMRYCDSNGKLDFKLKSTPKTTSEESDSEFLPWFVFPNRRNKDYEIFFGHWSTLGAIDAYHIHATDTGCLWGGQMTAYALESKQRFTIDCQQQCKPKLKKKKVTLANTMQENEQDDAQQYKKIPSPEEMLQRLNSVDVQHFNIETITTELKGNKIWVSILTIPVSAVILVIFTLLGSFLFDQPIVSFLVTAGLLFWVSKMFEGQEHHYKIAARNEAMQRIKEAEGEFGLIPHFKNFLPTKYRHLWQSLKKGKYQYVEQYVQAILLLQNKLNPEQFTRIWYLNYPETDPEYSSERSEYEIDL